jgi:hypothetical protein
MFGYFGGVAVAVTVAVFATLAWIAGTPFFVSRFGLWIWLAILPFYIFLSWATGLLPFLVIRKLAGKGGLRNFWLCLAAGVATVSLTLPIDLWIYRGLDFKGPSRPYLQELATLIAGFWPIFVISGAAGGIAYWWIERIVRRTPGLR